MLKDFLKQVVEFKKVVCYYRAGQGRKRSGIDILLCAQYFQRFENIPSRFRPSPMDAESMVTVSSA